MFLCLLGVRTGHGVEIRGPPCLSSPSLASLKTSMSAFCFAVGGLRLQMCAAVFYVGSGNLNLGPGVARVLRFDSSVLRSVC